jgi:hypothetical protein
MLDHHHVACHQASSIGPTPRICSAPEYNCSVVVGWVAEDVMEVNSKPVEMTDVQWTEIGVEGIVEERVIDSEVDWRFVLGPTRDRDRTLL